VLDGHFDVIEWETVLTAHQRNLAALIRKKTKHSTALADGLRATNKLSTKRWPPLTFTESN